MIDRRLALKLMTAPLLFGGTQTAEACHQWRRRRRRRCSEVRRSIPDNSRQTVSQGFDFKNTSNTTLKMTICGSQLVPGSNAGSWVRYGTSTGLYTAALPLSCGFVNMELKIPPKTTYFFDITANNHRMLSAQLFFHKEAVFPIVLAPEGKLIYRVEWTYLKTSKDVWLNTETLYEPL